jgi:hypothetical protein
VKDVRVKCVANERRVTGTDKEHHKVNTGQNALYGYPL